MTTNSPSFAAPFRGKTLVLAGKLDRYTAEQVAENTAFEVAGLDAAAVTREPTAAELELLQQIDPLGLRAKEVRA